MEGSMWVLGYFFTVIIAVAIMEKIWSRK